jgi:hypothetical protein
MTFHFASVDDNIATDGTPGIIKNMGFGKL